MSNWLTDLLGGQKKTAQLTNKEQEFEKKVQANDWIKEVMDDPEIEKTAAYEAYESMEETIKKDYERDVKILSDYALAEMLAEARWKDKGGFPENASEAKEDAKKSVEKSRDGAEKELLKLVGEHSALDWKKAFEKWHDAKPVEPKESDLYTGAKPETGKQNWEKKEDWKDMPSDEKKTEEMEGVGGEEKKGQVGKEAEYQPKTGEPCSCKPGQQRDNCPTCEGTGHKIDFKKIREGSQKEAHCGHCAEGALPDDKALDKMVETDIDHSIEQKHEGPIDCPICAGVEMDKEAVAPPEWEGTVRHMKKHHNIDNPFALAWYMKNKGNTPHAEQNPEIANQASKADVLKKIAEVPSKWQVTKDESGQEVIARVDAVESTTKESKEEDDNLRK